MKKVHLAKLKNLEPDSLHYAIVSTTDLVLVRSPDSDGVFVLASPLAGVARGSRPTSWNSRVSQRR